MKLKTIEITICEACLDGVGEECHTPGCALFIHNPPQPAIDPGLYVVLREWEEPDDKEVT